MAEIEIYEPTWEEREQRRERFAATAESGPVTLVELRDALRCAAEEYEGESYDSQPFRRLIARLGQVDLTDFGHVEPTMARLLERMTPDESAAVWRWGREQYDEGQRFAREGEPSGGSTREEDTSA